MNLKSITDKLQGRHTSAVFGFSLIGTALHWFHRLDGTYITFVGVMMGFITGKSVQDDLIGKKVAHDETPEVVAAGKS